MANYTASQLCILKAAVQVFQALGTANPSFCYDQSKYLKFTCKDGTTITNVRQDCSGLMQAIIRYMGYNLTGWFTTSSTSNTVITELDGSLSKDWVVLDFDANDRQPGDILLKSGHTDMYVFKVSGSPKGFNSGSGDTTSGPVASLGTGMHYSYNLAVHYLVSGKFDDTTSTNIGAYTITDAQAIKVIRYIGSGSSGSSTVGVDYMIVPAKKIIFKPAPGLIDVGTTISVTTDADDARVFVTLNNKYPDFKDKTQDWTGKSYVVTKNQHLRAIAFDTKGNAVAKGAATYTIPWIRPAREPIDAIYNLMKKYREPSQQSYLMYHPESDSEIVVEEYVPSQDIPE